MTLVLCAQLHAPVRTANQQFYREDLRLPMVLVCHTRCAHHTEHVPVGFEYDSADASSTLY